MPRQGCDLKLKQEILANMKQSGLSVYEVAKKHEISPRTIYGWLNKTDINLKEILKENRQLKAENEVLIRLVKKLSADIKKKR